MVKVKKWTDNAALAVAVISVIGYIAIVLLTFADIIGKKVFNTPISGTYELVERMMLIAVFSSFAYAQTQRSHINVTIIVERLPRRFKHAVLGLMSLLSVAISATLSYAAYRQSGLSLADSTVTGVLYIPLFPFFVIETIAMVFFTIILIIDTYIIFAGMWNQKWYELVNKEFAMDITPKKKEKKKAIATSA